MSVLFLRLYKYTNTHKNYSVFLSIHMNYLTYFRFNNYKIMGIFSPQPLKTWCLLAEVIIWKPFPAESWGVRGRVTLWWASSKLPQRSLRILIRTSNWKIWKWKTGYWKSLSVWSERVSVWGIQNNKIRGY